MRVLRYLLIVVSLVVSAKADQESATADWHRFRQAYPYHIQTAALSEVHPDGHRTLIVSEPPPGLSLEDIQKVSRDFQSVWTGTHTVGVDGWVKDVIIDVPSLTNPALTSDINRLNRLLFGTSYKAYALSIPSAANNTQKLSQLDLHVGSADLTSWLLPSRPVKLSNPRLAIASLDAKTTFTPLLGGSELSCDALLSAGRSGVFLSHPSGMVIWSFSKARPIDSLSTQIRQFALDTDMIVGAISKGDQLAVIGRERTTDVSLLPPLRTETVLQLAAAREDELSQSYERNNMMAGPVIDAEGRAEDWAPILLSSPLVDTEYGSLLNITDQLLKGWSQHGEVKYVNFQYPEPPNYPFQETLMKHLGVHEVTFNWNTKGAGYVSRSGPYEVYALNRTGALPIDYLADGRSDVEKAEDDAYNWYAGLNDPNLIRVVHYAAVYQIFHHFGVHANSRRSEVTQPFASLEAPAEAFLRKVAAYSDDQLASFKKALGSRDEAFVDARIRPLRDKLKPYVAGQMPVSIEQLAMASVNRTKAMKIYQAMNQRDFEVTYQLVKEVSELSEALMGKAERSRAFAEYRKADTQHPGTWIRTPSVVESTAKGGTGGHNLSSKVTLLEADETVLVGKVRVREDLSGQRVIRYNPRDDVRVNQVVRAVARDGRISDAELVRRVEQRMPTVRTAKLSIPEGLGHGEGIHPEVLRGFQATHLDRGYADYGWKPGTRGVAYVDPPVLKQLVDDSAQVMRVSRSVEGRYTVVAGGGRSVNASDQPSAIDALLQLAAENGNKKVHLHVDGLDERQMRGFLYSTERNSDDYEIVATRAEDLKLEDLAEIKQGQYDLRRAKLGKMSVSDPSATGFRTVEQEIDVPSRLSGFRDLVLRIRVTIKAIAGDISAITQQIAAQIQTLLSAAGSARDLRYATKGLVVNLQKMGIYAEVRAEIVKEGRNVFYVDNMGPPRDAARDNIAA